MYNLKKMIKFEMKSRESRFIFDPNVYLLEASGEPFLKLGFRTSLVLNEDDSFCIKNYDKIGQSCEIEMNLKDYNISSEDFIRYIERLEEKFKPENITSEEQIKDFLQRDL